MATGIQTGMNRGSRSGISRNSNLGKGPGGGGGPLGKVTEIWNNLGKGAKIGISVLLTLVVVGVGVGYLHSANNAYVKLYPAKLSDNDVREISTALTEMRIDHKIDVVDGIMLHPKKRVAAQAMLASRSLPREPVLTHDQVQGGLGKTAAEQKATRQRLLEGDITLALRAMEGINDAKVKLAVPDKTYFQDDTKQTTARIFLRLSQGVQFNRGQIAAMLNMVAASVPELTPENVTIIDSKGNDLSAMIPRGDDGGLVASGTQLEVQAAEEMRLQKKAQEALDKALPGRTEVSVNLEMDFSKIETENYTPGGAGDDGVVVTGRQVTREKLNRGDKGGESEGELMSGGAKPKDGSDYVNEKEATNYDVKKRIEKRVDTGFRIKRLTASVLADNVSDEEKAAIAGFVRNSIGLDETRGDNIEVLNVPFDRGMGFSNAASAAPGGWGEEASPAMAQGNAAQYLGFAVGAGALFLLGLVGMFLFKQHKVQADQGTIITSGSSNLAATTTTITDHFTEKSGKTTAPANSAGATQVNTTDQLEKLVKERPTKVAEMLKSTWLSQQ